MTRLINRVRSLLSGQKVIEPGDPTHPEILARTLRYHPAVAAAYRHVVSDHGEATIAIDKHGNPAGLPWCHGWITVDAMPMITWYADEIFGDYTLRSSA